MDTLAPKEINNIWWLITATLVWTVIVFGSLAWNLYHEKQDTIRLATHEAEAYFNKDKAIRLWSASHGGVYVPIDKRTPPNPHLFHIPERDITTPSGKKLTLMNPAYMLAQIMKDYNSLYGVKGKITAFPDKLLNQDNSPDQWEIDAMNAFNKGVREIKEVTDMDGASYLRLMRPLFIKQDCLKCHGFQGYKVNDLRGAIGVSVPMALYTEGDQGAQFHHQTTHVFFWVVGLIAFGYLFKQANSRQQERRKAEEELLRLNKKLRVLSYIDGLSNIPNRRAFNKAFDREWSRCRRDKKSLSLIMIDIDFFKEYNDIYGHQCGDECLKMVAQTLAGVLKRAGDMVARYGGEEFVMLLPGIELEQATLLAEECRNKILDQKIDYQTSKVIDVVSISLGVCATIPMKDAEASILLKASDLALYRAKKNGRNRVETAKL